MRLRVAITAAGAASVLAISLVIVPVTTVQAKAPPPVPVPLTAASLSWSKPRWERVTIGLVWNHAGSPSRRTWQWRLEGGVMFFSDVVIIWPMAIANWIAIFLAGAGATWLVARRERVPRPENWPVP